MGTGITTAEKPHALRVVSGPGLCEVSWRYGDQRGWRRFLPLAVAPISLLSALNSALDGRFERALLSLGLVALMVGAYVVTSRRRVKLRLEGEHLNGIALGEGAWITTRHTGPASGAGWAVILSVRGDENMDRRLTADVLTQAQAEAIAEELNAARRRRPLLS